MIENIVNNEIKLLHCSFISIKLNARQKETVLNMLLNQSTSGLQLAGGNYLPKSCKPNQ